MTQTEPKPAVYLLAEEMLAHAQLVYGDGDYSWQCGFGVYRMAFESAIVLSSRTLSPEEAAALSKNSDTFTFCGLPATASRFCSPGRLELYRWMEDSMSLARVSTFEFGLGRVSF